MIFKLLLSLCLIWNFVSAAPLKKVIEYEASYIGIPLLDMTLTWVEDDSSVNISYDNKLKPFIAYFHPIHNVYRVHFKRDSFSPLGWSKTVAEGDMKFQLAGERSTDGQTVTFSNGHQAKFPEGGFTVFSATHYLAEHASDINFFPLKIPVFIDGEIWEATARRFDSHQPHPDHDLAGDIVMIQTDLHYIGGKSILGKNDILTSVIATEGTQFLLWVRPDGTYIKAQFGRFPKAVVLSLSNN